MAPHGDGEENDSRGPLDGVKVLDMSALGPGPFCSMLLADFGAEVISVERPTTPAFDPAAFFSRGKKSVKVDLRAPGGTDVIARLAENVDVLVESNRPGTMERRGLGPDELCSRNPRLVYTRLTGWGQTGPYSRRAGHDINYIAVAGALGVLGGPDSDIPTPPLALLGDIAGGSMFAVVGILMALYERVVTGRGQVVDAAIVDGAALLNLPQLAEFDAGIWPGRGDHLLSGGAPFYGIYRCSDDRLFAVGAIEPKFYGSFLEAMGLTEVARHISQFDPKDWADLRAEVGAAFGAKPRSHWAAVFADVDACGTPVLDLNELAEDPHLRERGTIRQTTDGTTAGPAPRLSRTPGTIRPKAGPRGVDTRRVLADAGFTSSEIDALVEQETVIVA